jgi:phage-related protein
MYPLVWKLESYLDARGRNAVDEFVQSLTKGDQALVRARIDFLAEVGNRVREPLSKGLGRGLFELRIKSSRIFYCFKPGGVIVLLHGFSKKSQKTPQREMETALRRMEEVKDEK